MTMDPLTSKYFNISASSGALLPGWEDLSLSARLERVFRVSSQGSDALSAEGEDLGEGGEMKAEPGEWRVPAPASFQRPCVEDVGGRGGDWSGWCGRAGRPTEGGGRGGRRRSLQQGRPSRAEVTSGEGAAKGASSPIRLPSGNWEGSAARARNPGGKGWGSSGFPALTFQPPSESCFCRVLGREARVRPSSLTQVVCTLQIVLTC